MMSGTSGSYDVHSGSLDSVLLPLGVDAIQVDVQTNTGQPSVVGLDGAGIAGAGEAGTPPAGTNLWNGERKLRPEPNILGDTRGCWGVGLTDRAGVCNSGLNLCAGRSPASAASDAADAVPTAARGLRGSRRRTSIRSPRRSITTCSASMARMTPPAIASPTRYPPTRFVAGSSR